MDPMKQPRENISRWDTQGRRPKRRGFVLIMVLVLLAVIGLLLTGVARHSLRLTAEAASAQDDLQQRWGLVSLRRTLALRAGTLQTQRMAECLAEKQPYESPFPWKSKVELGQQSFEFTVDVEDRKLNLNRLSALRGNASLQEALAALSTLSFASVLRPTQVSDAHFFGEASYDSWGQVFDFTRIPGERPLDAVLQQVSPKLTLWGNGRLSFRDAPAQVLQTACGNRVSGTTMASLETLRQDLTLDLQAVLDQSKASASERRELEHWLTDEISTYSLHIQSSPRPRPLHQLAIVQQGRVTRNHFAW